MNLKISIILATLNRAHLIIETLNSIKSQTHSNFECLIIDDGCTDNTEEVLNSYLKDIRFKYLKRPNNYSKGISGARNYGLDIATGDFVVFFDDDDIVHPLNLETTIKLLEENNESNFCHFEKQSFNGAFNKDFDNVTLNYKKTPKSFFELHVTQKKLMASCTVLWRTSCFDTIRFNEQLQYAEDWECYTRILSTCDSGILLDCILYYNRKHTNSNTGEFWNHNLRRMASMHLATYLVIEYLIKEKMLTDSVKKYLIALSIGYRDRTSFNLMMSNMNTSLYIKIKNELKYSFFPLWKVVMKYFK